MNCVGLESLWVLKLFDSKHSFIEPLAANHVCFILQEVLTGILALMLTRTLSRSCSFEEMNGALKTLAEQTAEDMGCAPIYHVNERIVDKANAAPRLNVSWKEYIGTERCRYE